MHDEQKVWTANRLLPYATAVLGAALLGWWGISFPYVEARMIGENVRDFKELSERFESLAQEKGGEYAFEVLRRAKLPPNTDLHLLGHVVGDQLYAQEGVRGVTVCSQDFRNACSHSIVIGALNEFGELALPTIRDACKKAPGGSGAYTMCFHGLGHGVFAYYGYSIPETVEFCKTTGTEASRQREYIECAGGMVMELVGGGGHDRGAWESSRREYFSHAEPLAPCDTTLMPDDAKPICYMYLTPRLWELAGIDLDRPDGSLFGKAFALCDSIPFSRQKERDACYGGFGKEFVPLAAGRDIRDVSRLPDEELSRILAWCAAAPGIEGNEACVREAVSSLFWGGENDPDVSLRFCALAQSATRRACYEQLTENARVYTQGTARSVICARMPPEYRLPCGADST